MISEVSLGTRHDVAAALPRIDATAIDHDIRHAAILGALAASVRGIELVAPHDPQRLLHQIAARWPGLYAVDYLERDTAWRIAITPVSAT